MSAPDTGAHRLLDSIANQILLQNPDAVVRYRLLRDVLCLAPGSPALIDAQREARDARWVLVLGVEQRQDGSWGRFHSQDSRACGRVRTTEQGVARALAAGLDDSHPVLRKAGDYMAGLLEAGVLDFPDPPEKNDRWATGVRLFTAATLALFRPAQHQAAAVRRLWTEIAGRTFASGRYDAEAEKAAHRELTGATASGSYLRLNGKYQLALLSSCPGAMPGELETALLRWLWHSKDGIGYLGVPLSISPQLDKPGAVERWFSSLELASRFPRWRKFAAGVVEWIWAQRSPAGFWDFGRRASWSAMLPLSQDWRNSTARTQDWTTRTLTILRRYRE